MSNMKKAVKSTEINPNYNPEAKKYVLYISTEFYAKNGVQIYHDWDYYNNEDDAHAIGKGLMEEDNVFDEVLDYVVLDFPTAEHNIPGYLLRIWYGETRYIPIDCIEAMSLLDGEMTINQLIMKRGEEV